MPIKAASSAALLLLKGLNMSKAIKRLMKGENAWDSKKKEFDEKFLKNFKGEYFLSPKIDGIRCAIQNGVALTYTGKKIRNADIYQSLSLPLFDNLDFEITCGPWNAPDVYTKTYSRVMKASSTGEYHVNIFDDFTHPEWEYERRVQSLSEKIDDLNHKFFGANPFRLVPQKPIVGFDALLLGVEENILNGFEGSMLRRKDGIYKEGRSTLIEQYLLKVKMFSHSEARIIGYEEEYENTNETFYDVYGKAIKRKTKDGKEGKGRLGKYLCVSPDYSEPFKVSCMTMTHAERESRWLSREKDIGQYLRFKHLKHGEMDRPRHPLYAGFRHPDDFLSGNEGF